MRERTEFEKIQSQRILESYGIDVSSAELDDIEKGGKSFPIGSLDKAKRHVKTAEGWKPVKTHGHLIKPEYLEGTTTTEKVEDTSKTRPTRLSEFTGGSSLGGSSDAKLFTGPDGSKWVVKTARLKDGVRVNGQLEQEKLADDLYNLVGIKASDSYLFKEGGVTYKVASFLPDTKNLNALSFFKTNEAHLKLQKGFVMDALLGNWDVIGASQDNIMVNEAGEVFRIDNGGALEYRAKGRLKEKSDFGPEIKEIVSFRDSSKNPVAAKVYEGITDLEIRKQAKEILSKKDAIIRKALDFEKSTGAHYGIADKLRKRLEWLEENYVKEKPKPAEEVYDKSKYSSKVTADYFENGWNDFEMEGNPEIKAGMKKHILAIEKANESDYKFWANKKGVTVEQLKVMLQNHVEKLMAESDYFRMTDIKVLDLILTKHGRFKSQFETGTSHGSLSPSSRSANEYTYFAFPNDSSHDKENRPIYGYCSSNANGVNNSSGKCPPGNNASQYGQVTVKIKKAVALKKATVTFTDSLGAASGIAASPAARPHFTSLKMSNWEDPFKDESTSKRSTYTEIQYHNKLTFDDIESVHMSVHDQGWSSEKSTSASHLQNINKMIEIGRKTDVPIRIFGEQ